MTPTDISDCPKFLEFCQTHGDAVVIELLERIADAQWNGGKGEGVHFSDIHQHNACNHTLSGSIEHAGETLHFIIESGDWNGTVVKQWGSIDDVGVFEPPEPTRFTMVPIDDDLREKNPFMWRAYLSWRKQPRFSELIGKYSYDRHFQPGCATENYWDKKAAERGLKFAFESPEMLYTSTENGS